MSRTLTNVRVVKVDKSLLDTRTIMLLIAEAVKCGRLQQLMLERKQPIR